MYTLGEIPRKGVRMYRDKVALVFEGRSITYKELDDRVNRLANALIGLGMERGGRVTILADNSHKYMEIYFAAAKAGLSVTPLNVRLADKEIAYIANDCEATVCFVGDGLEERCISLKDELRGITHWISLDNRKDGYLFYEDLLKDASNVDPDIEVDETNWQFSCTQAGLRASPKGSCCLTGT